MVEHIIKFRQEINTELMTEEMEKCTYIEMKQEHNFTMAFDLKGSRCTEVDYDHVQWWAMLNFLIIIYTIMGKGWRN
jgi:hypothetical protein